MLVLSRKVGERLFIGTDIVIFINEARDGVARLGIEAPRNVRIHRNEPPKKETAKTPQNEIA